MSFSQLPKTIGPYEVQDVIGHGGMATVYKARQRDLERIVAIKVLLPAFAGDAAFRQRFADEARLVASLRHPNIVVIYGVGEADGAPYLAMEYLEGPTLLAAIRQRSQAGRLFTPAEALDLLRPLASALDYAHGHNVVHRDLKPENIILTAHGPVITDFGLAKLLQAEAPTVSLVMGTPAYMAPEQIEALPADRRTDVYALGILLYEVLSGRVPFDGPTPTAVTYAHLHDPPPPLAQLNPRLAASPRLEEVLQRAIAKRPEDRWPSAGALVAALAEAVAATGNAEVAATAPTRRIPVPPSRPAHLRPPPPAAAERGRLVLLVPLLLLLLIGGFAAARNLARSAPSGAGSGAPPASATAGTGARPEPTAYRRTVVAEAAAGTPTAAATAGPSNAPATSAASTAAPNSPVRGVVDAPAGAYLRGGPGGVYPIVAGVRDATAVTVLGRSGDWLDIAAATGERGWIAAMLVDVRTGDVASVAEEVPAIPPPAPPATAAPTPPAPTVAPRPAARGTTVRLEDTDFKGGFRNSGASVYRGRTSTWVYGQGSGYSSMSASFDAGTPNPGTATLTIVGMDSEGPARTPMRVALDGTTLYQGPDPLPDDNPAGATGTWGTLTLQLDASLLNAGANTITVTNLAHGPKGLPPFVAVDYAIVQLP